MKVSQDWLNRFILPSSFIDIDVFYVAYHVQDEIDFEDLVESKQACEVSEFLRSVDHGSRLKKAMEATPVIWKFSKDCLPCTLPELLNIEGTDDSSYVFSYLYPASDQPFPVYPDVPEHVQKVTRFIRNLLSSFVKAEFGFNKDNVGNLFSMFSGNTLSWLREINKDRTVLITFEKKLPSIIDGVNVYLLKSYENGYYSYLIEGLSKFEVRDFMISSPPAATYYPTVKLESKSRRNCKLMLTIKPTSFKLHLLSSESLSSEILRILKSVI